MSTTADSRQVFDDRFSLIYEELRRLAANVLRSESDAKLTPTTLVHETWLKLARSPELASTSSLHFRRIAARAMRQVLVEVARKREALRRQDGGLVVTFDELLPGQVTIPDGKDILALDGALERLRQISARQAEIVEGRFFGGLEVAELALLFDVSEATVAREWRSARAWLALEIRKSLNG
jgi:RNA polymerase sigma factor (TIGR02999 family)